jgi:hypothetical protein
VKNGALVQALFLALLLPTMGLIAVPDAKAGTETVFSAVQKGFWQYNVDTEQDTVRLAIS